MKRCALVLSVGVVLLLSGCGDGAPAVSSAPTPPASVAAATTTAPSSTAAPSSVTSAPTTPATPSSPTPTPSTRVPGVADLDPCTLLTDEEVLALTGRTSFYLAHQPAQIGSYRQCRWLPDAGPGLGVLDISMDYLPVSPDNVSSYVTPLPGEKGLGEHVREQVDTDQVTVEVIRGDDDLSVTIANTTTVVKDRQGLARALLRKAFTRL